MFTRLRIGGSVTVRGRKIVRWAIVAGREDVSAELPDRFARGHCGTEREIEAAAAALHRNEETRVGGLMHVFWYARRLAAKHYYVAVGVAKLGVGQGGFGREKNKPARFALSPRLEGREIDMARQGRHFEIVHAGPSQIAVGKVEAGRLDDIDGDAETGRHAQDGAGVAGDVGLVEGDADACGQYLHSLMCCVIATDAARLRQFGTYAWRCAPNASIEPSLSTRTNGGSHDYSYVLAPGSCRPRLTAVSGSKLSSDILKHH